MKISILLATCGRPTMLENMFLSLYETAIAFPRFSVEIVSVIDEDEESMDIAAKYSNVMDFSDVRRGALWAWNRALQISTGDILVPAGDDQIFHPNWLDYALESHQTKLNGYGVVGMNDLAYDGNKQLATMWLFDRRYCKEVMGGIFAPPAYHYYCVDSEWNEKAKMLGHFYWDERSKVEHLHSAHGKRPVDEIDEYKNDEWMNIDAQTLADRREKGFPITWQSLI